MIAKIAIIMMLSASAQADESICLSKVLFSEAQGESIEGIIALGEATIARSKRQHKSICKVQGVTRREPDKRLAHYWVNLAKSILKDGKKPIVGKADSWNTHTKPKHAGTIERVIGKHVFYVMRDM